MNCGPGLNMLTIINILNNAHNLFLCIGLPLFHISSRSSFFLLVAALMLVHIAFHRFFSAMISESQNFWFVRFASIVQLLRLFDRILCSIYLFFLFIIIIFLFSSQGWVKLIKIYLSIFCNYFLLPRSFVPFILIMIIIFLFRKMLLIRIFIWLIKLFMLPLIIVGSHLPLIGDMWRGPSMFLHVITIWLKLLPIRLWRWLKWFNHLFLSLFLTISFLGLHLRLLCCPCIAHHILGRLVHRRRRWHRLSHIGHHSLLLPGTLRYKWLLADV